MSVSMEASSHSTLGFWLNCGRLALHLTYYTCWVVLWVSFGLIGYYGLWVANKGALMVMNMAVGGAPIALAFLLILFVVGYFTAAAARPAWAGHILTKSHAIYGSLHLASLLLLLATSNDIYSIAGVEAFVRGVPTIAGLAVMLCAAALSTVVLFLCNFARMKLTTLVRAVIESLSRSIDGSLSWKTTE